MNKKKNLKGFTLIELIIVLAIFSVIMTLVMSFIDPVSRLMTKTSVKERTSAYVDNINEYISKSIRYAQNIKIYENGLYDEFIEDSKSDECTEEHIVREFVNEYYDGALCYDKTTKTYDNLKGKVHVLKLINKAEGDYLQGHIYESVYNFTAGLGEPSESYRNPVTYKRYTDAQVSSMTVEEKEKSIKVQKSDYHIGDSHFTGSPECADIKPSYVEVIKNDGKDYTDVINPESFSEYNYFYQIGLGTFEPISDNFGDEDVKKAKAYYSAIKVDKSSVSPTAFTMPISVVTYRNENAPKPYTYQDDSGNDVDTFVFKSPAAMSTLGLAFKNAQIQGKARTVKYYRKEVDVKYVDDDETKGVKSVYKKDAEGNDVIEAVNKLGTMPFEFISDSYTTSAKNIYIVYSVPDEINDTEWKITKDTTTTTASGSTPATTTTVVIY